MTRLLIRNPSDFPRSGYVVTPWGPIHDATGISPDQLVLRDGEGTPLLFQVDGDRAHGSTPATLTFILNRPVAPGADDYTRVSGAVLVESRRGHQTTAPRGALVEAYHDGVRIENERLEIWFTLTGDPERPWLSGSATSVLLDGLEMLDANRSLFQWLGADPEKRCMQVDRVEVLRAGEAREHALFDRPFHLLSAGYGPARAIVAIASEPFQLEWGEASGSTEYRLRRVLSLYRGATHLEEELVLEPVDDATARSVAKEHQGAGLGFTASFFADMDMGLDPQIAHSSHIPDWFAVHSEWLPRQGYGFATDAGVRNIFNPAPAFPNPEREHRSFSWKIGPARSARCLHLFSSSAGVSLVDEIGRAWYLHVYKPLTATLEL